MTNKYKAKIYAQLVFLVFMGQSIYLFFTKESVIAKTLVTISFVLFLGLSLMNIKSIRQSKGQAL